MFNATIEREVRVALSKQAQPVWFRITKWIVFVGVAFLLAGTDLLWFWLFGLPVLGVALHLVYRWKTQGWTRPWGGWNDLDAGR